jgi:hypothetical protein
MIPGLILATGTDLEDKGFAYLGNLRRELLSLFLGHQRVA